MAPPPNLEQLLATATFPGTTPAESRLVRGFLAKRAGEWDTASVVERIGRGEMLPPTYDPKERADWERRTRARPDLVLTRPPSDVAIVEAKEQITNEGIWQVLGYVDFWRADHPGDRVQPIVIGEAITSTAQQLARARGIQVLLYAAAPRALPTDPAEERTS